MLFLAIPGDASVLIEAAKQVPALVVLVFVVVVFLKHLREIALSHKEDVNRIEKLHSERILRVIKDYEATSERNIRLYEKVLQRLGAAGN